MRQNHGGGLEFDASTHAYYYEGEQLPSVTTITGHFYRGFRAGPEVLDRAAAVGTEVHHLTDVDEQPGAEPLTQDSQHAGFRAAAMDWRRTRAARTIERERKMGSRVWRVAGTMDRIVEFDCPDPRPSWWLWPDEVRGIVDWKTGWVPDLCQAQLAAYRHLAVENELVTPGCPLVAVKLREDGTWMDVWYRGSMPDELWRAAWTLYMHQPQGIKEAQQAAAQGYRMMEGEV